ncbi:Phytosulfokines 5 [Hordeum vulgare]|nr:Phytosulfokines 5 [Hordeum vulgare]
MAEAEAADAATRATVKEEATCAHILKKRQWRNTRVLSPEQNRTVREMAGLPSKEVEEVSNGEDSSGDKQIRLDLYCVFDSHFNEKDDKGSGKGNDSRG